MDPIDSAVDDFDLLAHSYGFRPHARFAGIPSPDFFRSAARDHSLHFGRLFTPAAVLFAWLTQATDADSTCQHAVLRLVAFLRLLGHALRSLGTGGFCKARDKIPEAFPRDLAGTLGRRVEGQAPDPWLWKGRHVRVVDGTLLHLPDTPENLADYPLQRSQRPGTGRTTMRVVVLLALATGVVLDAAEGPYRGKGAGEMSLLRGLLGRVGAGDVLLGDRYYGSFHLLATLAARGADGVFRLGVKRQGSFAAAECVGGDPDDRIQVWHKPQRPRGVGDEEWREVPEEIRVRVVRFAVNRRGFRCREVYLVTTLTDARSHTHADLAELYGLRWGAELDIRSWKRTLGMHELSCRAPGRVRAELWVGLMRYNLTRCVMAQAAWDKGWRPRQVSFATASRVLADWGDALMRREVGAAELTKALTAVKVGGRPGRFEPREVKRRPRKYPELKKARATRREELAAGEGESKKQRRAKKNRPRRG